VKKKEKKKKKKKKKKQRIWENSSATLEGAHHGRGQRHDAVRGQTQLQCDQQVHQVVAFQWKPVMTGTFLQAADVLKHTQQGWLVGAEHSQDVVGQ
jgi:hypothetical protein